MTLYHFTCVHSRDGIVASGLVTPMSFRHPDKWERLPEWMRPVFAVSWFTDLDVPMRDQLGLTMDTIKCDRTEVRFRVTDDLAVQRWTRYRRRVPRQAVAMLEGWRAMPAHWYVSELPVPVVLD